MTLTDIQDAKLFHLPDIQIQNQKSEKPGDSGHNRLVPKPPPSSDKTDIKIHEGLHKTLNTNVDNYPEHTSNTTRCVLSRQISKSDELAKTPSANSLSVPYGSPRLMTRRGHLSQPTLHDLHASKGFSRSQTQLHKLGAELLPEKFRPYKKSLSHREFSLEDKKCVLPGIVKNDSKRPVKTISRSSSAVTILPPLSNNPTSHLSVSQPDMLSPCMSPTPANSCTSLLARRLRMRDLWKRAFQKLRLAPPSRQEDSDGEEDSWVVSAGDVLRPVYSRWDQRRDALAEPERMCMPQVLREQIQKDVRSRKRSVKRRMSKFLNVNLGLNLEEDLAA